MRNITCADCEEYKNEWCEKIIDSPCPDLIRDCQYFHEKDRDLVRVVRCKDCKFYETVEAQPEIYTYCRLWADGTDEVEPDDYCSYGERRTDGKEVH